MKIIDQNKILTSLELSLENHSRLIDSRTEMDDLNFLVNFASLINFYDKTNTINGDWSPFLLKDPQFLLASIAKTPFNKLYTLFLQTNITLEETLILKKLSASKKEQNNTITNCFNQLFKELLNVFHLLERWIHFMLQSSIEYNLKDYVINEVKNTYSQFLWALLWLKEQLHISKQIKGITAVNKYYYTAFNPQIWKQATLQVPYPELLELKYPLEENTDIDICNSLKKTGKLIFSFFNSIIEYSSIEFENIKKDKDLYPDTLLLRTFTNLMEIYKNQVNKLSKKHLRFYYKDILHQKKRTAIADSVFVSADLSEINSTFKLPKNSLFNAGQYPNETPILFETKNDVLLNPAIISETYTIAQKPLENGFYKLYKKQENDVNTVQKDEDDTIKSWKTFGSQNQPQGKEIALGFAIASPMLMLREGKRELTITYTFSEKIDDLTFFKNGNYFLSTEEDWYSVPKDSVKITSESDDNCKVNIKITLQGTDPAIVSFLENPDGLDSSWPMFKMSYSEFKNLAFPPTIDSLKINVDVTELKTFQLYNDFGLLESEKPFQPLGPTPEKKQGFMIGNSEVFSKPIDSFSIELDWDNLPENFASYYEQYNKFLAGYYQNIPFIIENKSFFSFLKALWPFSKKKNNTKDIVIPVYETPFNDRSFKVEFQLLQNKKWLPVNMNISQSFWNSVYDINAKNKYEKELFQGSLKIKPNEDSSLKITDILSIRNNLNINNLFSLEDHFEVIASLKVNDELEIIDTLEITGLLKIEERLTVSDVIKIKNDLTVDFLFQNEDTIKVTDLFELNQNLKIADAFLLNSKLNINNTLLLEAHLNSSTILLADYHTVKSINLNIENLLFINSSLKISDVLEINKNLVIKDLIDLKGEDIIKIKEGAFFNDLIKIGFGDFKGNLQCTGTLVTENKLREIIHFNISGKLELPLELSIRNKLQIHENISFQEIVQIDNNAKIFTQNLGEELYQYSTFGSTKIDSTQKIIQPSIQKNPLEFNESTTTGFIRMQLLAPKYGFGVSIYPKVVSAIALYNADIIALNFNENGIDFPLASPANEPFTPMVGLFKGSYTSNKTYYFFNEEKEYPIECFYYDTFKNYKVYDSNLTKKKNKQDANGFPALLPKVEYLGGLFLGLEQVITPAEISFYFELTQDYTSATTSNNENVYKYLEKKGWQELSILSDSTNNFNCSGIITANAPKTITKVHHTMPNEKYWVSFQVTTNPDDYCQTSFLKTNGFELQRTGENYKHTPEKPEIKANSIETSFKAIPEIAIVSQPFSSFGGKIAETEKQMNKRVSLRIKTKDRAVTSQDFYRIIIETYLDIFYVKTVYDRIDKQTNIFLVQKIQNKENPNAYLPLVNECLQQKIEDYLIPRVSEFANIQVQNFEILYIKITGKVKVSKGYKPEGVAKEINSGINTFLSPWITTTQAQIKIDNGLSTAQVSEFIKTYKNIDEISELAFFIGKKNPNTGIIKYGKPLKSIKPKDLKSSVLLVPSLNNKSIKYS